MAYMVFNFESQYLHGNTQIGIILPDKPRNVEPKDFYKREKKYKVLWLLHGSFGDYSDWVRKSNIELYACENDLVVVMPSAMNSSYTDWYTIAHGYEMNKYFFEELMPMIYNWFPVSGAKEDNYIAGLSMGGRGSLKFALTHPECFAKAAVLSSSPFHYEEDVPGMTGERRQRMETLFNNAGGYEAILKSDDNLWRLTEEADTAALPPMYFGIGGEDPGMARFERYRELAQEKGLNAQFEVIPGYAHEWRVWELTIQRALSYFGFSFKECGNAF